VIRVESQHDIAFPREAVWPVLSRTDWINRSMGLPPVDYDIAPRAEGGSEITAQARMFGMKMRWRELPFEWCEPEFYRVRRVFESGPFTEVRLGLELREHNGGTRIVACSEMEPRGITGKLAADFLLASKAKRDMARIVAHVEKFLRGQSAVALPRLPVHPVNEATLQTGIAKLRDASLPAAMIDLLESLLRDSPDVELAHLRPFAVARKWSVDRWATLRLFLHATRAGLLDLSWEVLCPACRSSRAPLASSLGQLKRTAHCDVCQIEFDAEFDKSVELKFAVNPALRPREQQTFCLAGPGGKPHVITQLLLEAHEERAWKWPAVARPVRLRSPQVKKPTTLELSELSSAQSIICQQDGFVFKPAADLKNGTNISNPNAFPVLVSLEQLAWDDDILTAARVTNWQEFRDLFASEVISPNEEVTVGSQVVLFTDLLGSTALYRTIGDAPAYVLVRNHFAVLLDAIRANHGTVVKTIGDAVMAAFSRVDEAFAAVRQMHEKLPAADPRLGRPPALKSSLHVGPCLAVNANGRLDFFGTTINLAARMVACCQGGDLTISDELFHRPEFSDFAKHIAAAPEPSEVNFHGFAEPHRVWRIPIAQQMRL